jgi:predicted NAD/FAD-binding protein
VGAGISGLGAAYLLSRGHDVEVFERGQAAGGHTYTVEHRAAGRPLRLDMGFLVLNDRNYPLLGRLFRELGVATQDSEMSFSVGCAPCRLEYSGRRPFAQRRNLARPRHVGLLAEIARWLRTARRSLEERDFENHTLGRYVEDRRFSVAFRDHFLVPLTSALWSTAPGRALDFPAAYAIRFFDNHGMLGFGRLGWKAVRGGSRTYVDELLGRLDGRVRVGLGVRALRRDLAGVELLTDDGTRRRFDKVVVAAHADQALGLLADPSDAERRILGSFAYSRNEAVLHTDARLLPREPRARASWNFHLASCSGGDAPATITYSLNRLQRLEEDAEYCVTLNRTDVDPARVITRATFDHPVYTRATLDAQPALRRLSGERHTYYAGAHLGNGFHEDGLASGVAAAAALGVSW